MNNLSPNFWPDRVTTNYGGDTVTGKPEIIVLHMTEGNYGSARSWLCNPASQASSNVLIGKNGVELQLVRDEDAPWTNGFQKGEQTPSGSWTGQKKPPTNKWVLENCWNAKNPAKRVSPSLYSLTIEIEWFQSDGVIPIDSPLYGVLVRRVAYWCNRWGIPATRERIIGHYEISPVEKPFCGRHIPWDYLIPDVQKLIVPPADPHEPSPWAKDDWELAKMFGITDGTNPKEPCTREQVAVMIMRGLKTYHQNPTVSNPISG